MSKEYVIFAGVNGAGKSTFYKQLQGFPARRVNSDEILRQNGGDWRNVSDQAKAMKEAVIRINDYLKRGISFNQETTLAGNSIISNIKKAKAQGYTVKVYYVGLESADLAVERVGVRVRQGGHGIAEEDVRRRYEQSLENLKKIIPICDVVKVYDNTKSFVNVAIYENGVRSSAKECGWLESAMNKENEPREKEKQINRDEKMELNEWRNVVDRPTSAVNAVSFEKQQENTIETIESERE